ncbi:hypothetical protein GJ496_008076 [Pomphorhynchus laevis]|nr:hypothetical protein GJ496_008076 [Pomphorhynchus laevis]
MITLLAAPGTSLVLQRVLNLYLTSSGLQVNTSINKGGDWKQNIVLFYSDPGESSISDRTFIERCCWLLGQYRQLIGIDNQLSCKWLCCACQPIDAILYVLKSNHKFVPSYTHHKILGVCTFLQLIALQIYKEIKPSIEINRCYLPISGGASISTVVSLLSLASPEPIRQDQELFLEFNRRLRDRFSELVDLNSDLATFPWAYSLQIANISVDNTYMMSYDNMKFGVYVPPVHSIYFPKITIIFLMIGILLSCWFFTYEITRNKYSRRILKEVGIALLASTFIGFGGFFLLLAVHINL